MLHLAEGVGQDGGTWRDGVDVQLISIPVRVDLEPPVAGDDAGAAEGYVVPPVLVADLHDGVLLPALGAVATASGEPVFESFANVHVARHLAPLLEDAGRRRPGLPRVSGSGIAIDNPRPSNYFHWWLDSIGRVWLVDEAAGWPPRPLLGGPRTAFERETLDELGLAERYVQLDDDAVVVDRLAFASGIAHQSVMRLSPQVTAFSRWAGERLGIRHRPHRRIFVSRARAAVRRMVNEDEVAEALAALGFERVALEDLGVRQQAQLFAEAELVVAPHGAGLTNLLFAPPRSALVECFSAAGSHDSVYRRLVQLAGGSYAAVTGSTASEARPNSADMDVDVDHLLSVVRQVAAHRPDGG